MSDQPTMLVSGFVKNMDQPTPGSVEVPCGTCSEPLWVSEPGQDILAQGGVPVCLFCSVALMQPGDRIEAAPGVEEELQRLLPPEQFAALMEFFNEWKMRLTT